MPGCGVEGGEILAFVPDAAGGHHDRLLRAGCEALNEGPVGDDAAILGESVVTLERGQHRVGRGNHRASTREAARDGVAV